MLESESDPHIDWVSYYLSTIGSSHQGCSEYKARAVCQKPFNSELTSVLSSIGLYKTDSKTSDLVEGSIADPDGETNTSFILRKNHQCDDNESAKKPVSRNTFTHPPVVSGSSPSNANKISGKLNSQIGLSVASRTLTQPSSSARCIGKCDTVDNHTDRVDQLTGDTMSASVLSGAQGPGYIPPASQVPNPAGASFRSSGPGRESSSHQVPLHHAPVPSMVESQMKRPMSMSQRLSMGQRGTTNAMCSSLQLSDSSSHTCQLHQAQLLQLTVCNRLQPDTVRETNVPASSLSDVQFSVLVKSALCDKDDVNTPKSFSSGDDSQSIDSANSKYSNKIGCTSVLGINIHRHQQEMHYSEKQLLNKYSSDCHDIFHQNHQPVLAQNTSPCVSEGSHSSHSKDSVSKQNGYFKNHYIQPSLSEVNSIDDESLAVEELQDCPSKLHVNAGDINVDQVDAIGNALLSQLPATQQVSGHANSGLFIGASHTSDMSEILENFPSFSSKLFEDRAADINYRSQAEEMKYLSECLEKERYRRKHCEEHILKQDAKLLEVQQHLAVAVSASRRKDAVVEQLDKQLAHFVEGWRKKDEEKDEHIKVLKQTKRQVEETMQSQLSRVSSIELVLSKAIEELNAEKLKSAQTLERLNNEVAQVKIDKEIAEDMLEEEILKQTAVMNELNDLKECKELAERKALEAEDHLMKEKDRILKKEQELVEELNKMTEANQMMINLEDEIHRQKEIEARNKELKVELDKSSQAIEQLIIEKEAQKTVIADLEVKFQNVQQKIVEDFGAQMERKIADQALEFYFQMEQLLEKAAVCHAREVKELNTNHRQELEKHAVVLNTEMLRKEKYYQQRLQELEERLQIMTTENTLMKEPQVTLESQRMEVLSKLQVLMLSHWNEAVSLLVSAPQKMISASSIQSSHLSDDCGLDKVAPSASHRSVVSVSQPVISQENHQTSQDVYHSPQDVLCCGYAPVASSAVLEVREDQMCRIKEIEKGFEKSHDYKVLGALRQKLEISESCLASQPSAPSLHAFSSGSLPSFVHEPNRFSSEQCMAQPQMTKETVVLKESDKDEVKSKCHTYSLMSPQKNPRKNATASHYCPVKSGQELPISRNSNIFCKNPSCDGLVAPYHLHAGIESQPTANCVVKSFPRDSSAKMCTGGKYQDAVRSDVSPSNEGFLRNADGRFSCCQNHR